MSVFDKVKKLVDGIKALYELFKGKKCICVDMQTYQQINQSLDEAIALLEDIKKQIEQGVIGEQPTK